MGSFFRLVFLAFWVYLLVGPIWRALEDGEPQRAVMPGVFLLLGMWAVLKKTRKKQEASFESVEPDAPWEQSEWHEEEPTDGPWNV